MAELSPVSGHTSSPDWQISLNHSPADSQSIGHTDGDELVGDNDPITSLATVKAISAQPSHYVLTFENGLQDDSDLEVEEYTKSMPGFSDSNNNRDGSVQNTAANVKVDGTSEDEADISRNHRHMVHINKEKDIYSSDEWDADRSDDTTLQDDILLPASDSDLEPQPHTDQHKLTGADNEQSSFRPDTPTPLGFQTPASVESLLDSGLEQTFIRPKPLSGSTTAMFGSIESLSSPGEVQLRNKRYPLSFFGGRTSSDPVEGSLGNAKYGRSFHGSMHRLSMPAFQNLTVMSDDESGRIDNARGASEREGWNRRWSLTHSDAMALEKVRLLQSQLEKVEKELKRKDKTYQQELTELRKENDRHQKLIGQNLASLGPEAKIEATMQHEITRMTSENLDLRETIDKQAEQIRKLKKMLKVYAKKLKDGEAAEIAAELEQDEKDKGGATMGATVKHRERTYMGMLEYRREDEAALIKNLIIDLKPKVAAGLIPGVPAYILFMCVRHTDYINDDDKVKALLTGTINGIKKVVKKHHEDLDRITLWLANTCRLMHTFKQYSGEKQFQDHNQPRQNEMCLRNFDLSEYRQVFSDLAIWIYQTLIKLMQELIQPNIVPAMLEHEAIAGLTASKPAGLRGRSTSTSHELEDDKDALHALDKLMRTLNSYMRILTQHAVDPELVKQIFRQVYYHLCAGALNNLLLRKDMCNWSKGMQIRYNLSHLEQWLRDNKLQESGAQAALDPIVQASQLLQARKTDSDVESICEMCSKLTIAQIIKILNLYTPVDEFEERVPVTFIRKIQARLKDRPEAAAGGNTLLMDTKFSFPVTFPFNPSSILLDTIDVPEQLHLGFLKKL